MPIYEYACTACGHEFEEWQKMSDAPVRTCPKCKKKKVERLISRTAFQLKGGGWYADLYSSSKPGEAKESGKGAEAKGKSDSGDSTGASGGSSSESTAKASGDGGKSSGSAGKSSGKKKESSAKKAEPRAA
jgi:putative FmdB family regulatory protein